MTKPNDLDNELKEFFGDAIDYFYGINAELGQYFLKGADDVFLNDKCKYNKWLLNTPEKDKNIDACKSIDFLSSEEFKKWPVEKKAHAILNLRQLKNKGGLEIRITLADYENLIQKNKTDWPPFLKNLAMSLINGDEFVKTDFNLDFLDRNDFASWSIDNQFGFLEFCADNKNIFKDLYFETMLKHPIFNKISRSARYLLVKMLIDRGQKPKDDIDKLDIPSLRKFELLELLDDNKEFKTQNKLFNFNKALEKQMKDMNKKDLTVKEIEKVDGFKSLAPEEKVYTLSNASDLKISDLESIKNVEKITDIDAVLIDGNTIFNRVFENISGREDGGLNFASLIKSKLPPFARLKAFQCLDFVGDKNIRAFKIIANLGVLNLLSWKIEQSDKKLVDKDLTLLESVLIEFMADVQVFSADLNLSKNNVETLKELSKDLSENKNKPLKERIVFLEKMGRIILNILQVPLFFTDMGKQARSWFFEPGRQIQYNAAKKKIGRVLSKIKTEGDTKKKEEKNKDEK